jgi:hypothetical protein
VGEEHFGRDGTGAKSQTVTGFHRHAGTGFTALAGIDKPEPTSVAHERNGAIVTTKRFVEGEICAGSGGADSETGTMAERVAYTLENRVRGGRTGAGGARFLETHFPGGGGDAASIGERH